MTAPEITRADSPLLLALPHTGTDLPDDLADRLNDRGRALADTDWHIDRLYAGLVEATTIRTPVHRYMIDVNRAPEDESLYPGQNTTGLCPLTDFDGQPIYRAGAAPDAAEIARRVQAYHAPYHAALTAELERLRARHGYVVLYDCHSIRSQIPFLFDGVLPDLNIGTNGGTSCARAIEAATAACAAASPYTAVVNGRFRGGWTTRHYGRPGDGIHAIQMELAQSTYLTDEAPPWAYDSGKAERLRRWLTDILGAIQTTASEVS